MTKRLPSSSYYSIRAAENFYRDMRHDVELLRDHGRHTTCTTVILSCLDALAAGPGEASARTFAKFVRHHFPELCADLDGTVKGKSGANVLYDRFRNGFAHLRGPKSAFAIADNAELDGRWAGELEVDGKGTFVAINVERLTSEFLSLIDRLEKGVA